MNLDNPSKFSKSTLLLHWSIGLTIMGLLATGIYMSEFEFFPLYPIHKSIGVLMIALVIWRVIWRIKNGWPVSVGQYSTVEKTMAKIVHYLLLIGSILLPLSGFMMSAIGGYGVSLFGLELVAANPDPNNPQEMIPFNGAIAHFAHNVHGLAGKILLASVLLHIVGALKHHIIDKDSTLRRMLGAEVNLS